VLVSTTMVVLYTRTGNVADDDVKKLSEKLLFYLYVYMRKYN